MSSYPALAPGTVVRQPGYKLTSEPDGLASMTEVFRGYFNDMVNRISVTTTSGLTFSRQYRSAHPSFPSLGAQVASVEHVPGAIDGKLIIQYRGLDPAFSYPPPPIYNIDVTTASEPLSTSPLWTSDIAGTPAAPKGGSVWVSYDKNGANYNPAASGGNPGTFDPNSATFYGWLNGAIFAGVEDYLAAGATYKKTYTDFNLPDISKAGTFSTPDGSPPALPAGYSWFFLGCETEDNSNLYRIVSSWKAVPNGAAAAILYGGAKGQLSYSTYTSGSSGGGGATGAFAGSAASISAGTDYTGVPGGAFAGSVGSISSGTTNGYNGIAGGSVDPLAGNSGVPISDLGGGGDDPLAGNNGYSDF